MCAAVANGHRLCDGAAANRPEAAPGEHLALCQPAPPEGKGCPGSDESEAAHGTDSGTASTRKRRLGHRERDIVSRGATANLQNSRSGGRSLWNTNLQREDSVSVAVGFPERDSLAALNEGHDGSIRDVDLLTRIVANAKPTCAADRYRLAGLSGRRGDHRFGRCAGGGGRGSRDKTQRESQRETRDAAGSRRQPHECTFAQRKASSAGSVVLRHVGRRPGSRTSIAVSRSHS